MKFLIIRFSSIGDIVLTTPVIRCLKQQISGAEVHFLVKKNFYDVVKNNSNIDKIFIYDDNMNELASRLKEENYDAIIDLQKNLLSLQLKNLLRIKSYSFNKLNIQKWIYVNFKINLLPPLHIVNRYLESVKSFGVVNDHHGLDFFITEEDERAVNDLPEKFNENYIGWVIGAKHFTKRLPPEKLLSIAKKINSPIVILGGKEDFEMGERIREINPYMIFNACGKYTINQSAAFVKNAKLIITHDTGLMHIAAALDKKIISIWGNTVPEFGMEPYYGDKVKSELGDDSVKLEVLGLSCRPCSKIGFEKCPRGHFKCMKEIDENIFIGL
jgi:ADP-heptose:LPS heptosyltransferase